METATATRNAYEVDPTVGDRAEAWYNAGLRQRIETRENLGKYLIINPQTGEYVMGTDPRGDDDLEVSHQAIAKFGTHRLFGIRIGYPATEALGTTLEPFTRLLGDEHNEDAS